MGTKFFDQYSILHFATGIVAYFWGFKWWLWLIIHSLFEYLENTDTGIDFINTFIKWWPGGKPYPDYTINSIGDSVFAVLGWLLAYAFDKIGTHLKWYEPHIKG